MEEQAGGKREEQERRRVHMEELYKEAQEEIRLLQVNMKEIYSSFGAVGLTSKGIRHAPLYYKI